MSSPRASLLTLLGRALGRTFSNLGVLLPWAMLLGGVGHVLMYLAALHLAPQLAQSSTTLFIASEVIKLVVSLLLGVLLVPLVDAITIYVWRESDKGHSPSLYAATNWGILRYARMFRPHMYSYLAIAIGMQVVIPGVLYALQYAFVDAIAATDDNAKQPLARSQKLTQGRRSRIARAWLPYALWYPAYYFYFGFQAEALGAWAVFLFGVVDVLLLMAMEMVMFALYEERIAEARAALERQQAKEAAAGGATAGAAETTS
jgi:small-conductance mechanosensitive channel